MFRCNVVITLMAIVNTITTLQTPTLDSYENYTERLSGNIKISYYDLISLTIKTEEFQNYNKFLFNKKIPIEIL